MAEWVVCIVCAGLGGDRECEAGADSVAGGYSEWITESCMVLISSLELSASCHYFGSGNRKQSGLADRRRERAERLSERGGVWSGDEIGRVNGGG